MTTHILSWTDGYIAVRKRANHTRGFIELESRARWPCTTGDDVISIAAMFDPEIHANATPGLLRRWRSTIADLERYALSSPSESYRHNRRFWSILESAAVFLDYMSVTPPETGVWEALIEQIGLPQRSTDPSDGEPFAQFDHDTDKHTV